MSGPLHLLVTGGTGFIGSHTVALLLEAGHEVTILDNLSNSDASVVDRLQRITGRRPAIVVGDVRDAALLSDTFARQPVDAVLHFAGLKAVGESVAKPLDYYEVNVGGSVTLFQAMAAAGVNTIVFSSSATVYGDPAENPITEACPRAPANPYGRCKAMIEDILFDQAAADPDWRVAILRYFNPVGAHPSGLIGEMPRGVPNNLMPYVAQVAAGQRPFVQVFGDDYPTPDGTGRRDYIHVMDLAKGHVDALAYLRREQRSLTVNLGRGAGVSVLEMIHAFTTAAACELPYRIGPRRPGDVPEYWAVADKAHRELGWQATRTVSDMCADTWRWMQFSKTLDSGSTP